MSTEEAKDQLLEHHHFEIRFVTLFVRVVRNVPVKLINVRDTFISDTYLMYQTHPELSDDAQILYSIVSPPREGMLLLTRVTFNGDVTNRPVELRKDSSFSQVDLLSGHLKYQLLERVRQPVEDSFSFVVRVGEQTSALQTFSIEHVPGNEDVEIKLERLEVEEGGRKTISQRYLHFRRTDHPSGGDGHFLFNVTKPPRHGTLDVLAPNKVKPKSMT